MSQDRSAPEAMRYSMLGGDPQDTAEKLAKYTGEVGWPELRPHYESGVLLYVDPALALAEAGAAMAADHRAQVERWLKSGDLVRPGPPHAAHWEAAGGRFNALVVSPFVLAQPVGDDG